MKIAIYHPWVYLKSGLERTILEICKQTKHEVTVFTSHFDKQGTYPELANYRIVEINPVSVERSYGAVLSAGKTIAATRLPLDDFDVLVICCDGLGSFLQFRNRDIPTINLCFTPLRAVYDLEYRKRHLQKHSQKQWIAHLMEWGYKLVDKWCWKQYSKIICISKAVEERVLAARLCKPEDIVIYYPGIDENHIQVCPQREPYFFLPGRIMWTKNIELGIEAFKHFCNEHGNNYRLVIAGMVDKKSEPYYAGLKALAEGYNNIEFVIGPSDQEMQTLYSNCYATLFTAFNEDLGLTPMEAMSRGKPVVAVNKGGPKEVVANGETGYLVDGIAIEFAKGIAKLAADPAHAEALGVAGAERVKRFTWQQFVKDFDAQMCEFKR
ncbi:glycosyltransferase family 4 protein [Aestuariibacter sp. GS-14]|uniref:glycosyltransferase family 4 protein n=1 Tax=Aestuariibacter sp. GS-14 TaxID=2590670 RepID=UPI0015E837F2|nr:glycosyltransferase family 4 protein [Aestuariibacter sp. GS-14]